ncbi:NADP-dependent oxidoreductase [Candidatus Gottesmanbacteria bacterium]|nr:NADP-dependent oxidoreductase [Candidatus Gottesmanbacteria bacterium]
MKAAQIHTYGGSEVIEINENAPMPILKAGQVLVQVHAASINPFDAKFCAGLFQKMMPVPFPIMLGGDFAGEITQIGEGVTDLKIGDRVYGQGLILSGGSGTLAEYVAANAGTTALKPTSINCTLAASLPLVGVSAIQGIEEHIKLLKGQKILIHGGAGGIGSIAIQLAKSHGAYVTTTVGNGEVDFVKNLGADQVIDYKSQKFDTLLKEYDAVFDTVGGEVTRASFSVLKKVGILVSMAGAPDETMAKQYGVTAVGQNTRINRERLNHLTDLVDSGKIKVQVDTVYPLSQVKEAFNHLETGHPKGKVVVKMNG